MSRCKVCGQPIVWTTTSKHGSGLPLDPAPTLDGEVVIEDGWQGRSWTYARILEAPDREQAAAAGEVLYRLHFVTCRRLRRPT